MQKPSAAGGTGTLTRLDRVEARSLHFRENLRPHLGSTADIVCRATHQEHRLPPHQHRALIVAHCVWLAAHVRKLTHDGAIFNGASERGARCEQRRCTERRQRERGAHRHHLVRPSSRRAARRTGRSILEYTVVSDRNRKASFVMKCAIQPTWALRFRD